MQKMWAKAGKLGPGLITASTVLGPGSIVASSRAGAQGGYRLLWMLVAACLLMAAYTSMGARLGCALESSPLDYLARRTRRWLAALAGLSAFFVTAAFQFGNNLGVSVAFSGLFGGPSWLWPPVFTAAALGFLFFAGQLYRWIERFMIGLVAVMILAFVANLFWTGINLRSLAGGLVPRMSEGDGLIARAMLGTTFSVVAAFYQAYLVQAKGWKRSDLSSAIRDAWTGIAVLGGIAAVILIGSAQTLHGKGDNLQNASQLAAQLKGALGPAANAVFCLGLAAASFSSFIVNALIGGHLLADGLGLESRMSGWRTKTLAAVVMLAGCAVAVAILVLGKGQTTSLLVAQASTLVAAPLCTVVLFVLTCRPSVMGDLRNRWPSMMLGGFGLAVILWLNALGLRQLF